MVLNDSLACALSNILNSDKTGKSSCIIYPESKVIRKILDLFKSEGLVGEYTVVEDIKGNSLVLNLIGKLNKCGVIKPRYSVTIHDYEKFEKRYLPARNLGVMLISTSQGIIKHIEAKKKNIGGRLLAFGY